MGRYTDADERNDNSGRQWEAPLTDEAALADMRRMHEAVAKGHSRRIVCIDGPPGRPRWQITADGFKRIRGPFPLRDWLRWALLVVRSYCGKWLVIVRRATVERHVVAARMAELDAAILKATTAAEAGAVGTKGEARSEPETPASKGVKPKEMG